MNYIGIDCHITTLDFAVVSETGKLVKAERADTSARNLITFIKGVKKPRVAYIEEGELANWILETCNSYGEKLVITNPKNNLLIGKSGKKNDRLDAEQIAQLARGNYIKEVYHPVGQRRQFKELMIAYHDTVKSSTRIKNKIKARFRSKGVQCTGESVYSKRYRQEWRGKLPDEPGLLMILENLWLQMDQLEEMTKRILAEAKKQSKQYPEIRRFQEIPGVGFITAATISAILETPWRFANKRKLWMYAGLGIVKKESGGKTYSEKLTRDYNRLLKYSIKQAGESALKSKDNPFGRKYLDMTLLCGVAPHRARLTVAREILATMWAMWRKGEEYKPELRATHRTR